MLGKGKRGPIGKAPAPAATVLVALTTALGTVGCGEAPPPPPTAVVRTRPSSVCLHDGNSTTFSVDGSESSAGLTLVPVPPSEDEPPLAFEWSFAGDAHEVLGEPTEVEVSLTTAGERPLHITLSVTNAVGGTATTWHTLPLTIPPAPQPCADGWCPAELQCVAHGGEQLCLPPGPCLFPADCPVCFTCDDQLGQCVPVEVSQ